MSNIFSKLAVTVVLIFGFSSLIASSDWSGQNDELNKDYKRLARSFKALNNAGDMNEVKQSAAEFEIYLTKILSFQDSANPEEKEIFKVGREKLAEAFEDLKQSIANNESMEVIASKIQNLGDIRKQYHKKLGIGKK